MANATNNPIVAKRHNSIARDIRRDGIHKAVESDCISLTVVRDGKRLGYHSVATKEFAELIADCIVNAYARMGVSLEVIPRKG